MWYHIKNDGYINLNLVYSLSITKTMYDWDITAKFFNGSIQNIEKFETKELAENRLEEIIRMVSLIPPTEY